jgi:hypothetical protein
MSIKNTKGKLILTTIMVFAFIFSLSTSALAAPGYRMAEIGSFGTSNIHCSYYFCKDPNLFKINLDSNNVAIIQKMALRSTGWVSPHQTRFIGTLVSVDS